MQCQFSALSVPYSRTLLFPLLHHKLITFCITQFFFFQTFKFTNLSQPAFYLLNCKGVFKKLFDYVCPQQIGDFSVLSLIKRVQFYFSLDAAFSSSLQWLYENVGFSFCVLTSRSLSLFFSLPKFAQKKGETYRQDSVRDE